MKQHHGFTLIELMVTVAIIAVLAMIALPAYQSYILKSRRIDAKNALVALQLAQEKYRGNNATYAQAIADLGIETTSPQGYYTIAIKASSAPDTTYEASATAKTTGPQATDNGCLSLSVTQAGFVVDSTAACWGLN